MKRQRALNIYFPYFVYTICLVISLVILWQGRLYGLFPMPRPGMDQLNFLEHADKLLDGILPDQSYKLSSAYTVFLALLNMLTGGKIILMRILQAALCSLIPVFIFKLCRLLRCSFLNSQLAALIYCFYGPALLLSLGFLRAAPLGLCFLVFVYLLVKAFYSKKWYHYLTAGLLAGITVLGRENFIPVVMAPFIMLIFPAVRKHVKYKKALLYLGGILLLLVPMIIYNYVRFDSPEVIPGNFAHIVNFYHGKAAVSNPDKLAGSILEHLPSQIKMFASSYENPNSLSFYAHREIIFLLTILFIPFNLILVGAILALTWDFRHLRTLFVGGMATGYFLTIIYFSMFYRFRIVDVPLLCVLCGILLQVLISARKRKLGIIFSAVFALVFLIFTYVSPNKLRPASERRSTVQILIINQDYYKAEDLIDGLKNDNIPLNNLDKFLIKSLYDRGYKADARRLYAKYIENNNSDTAAKK